MKRTLTNFQVTNVYVQKAGISVLPTETTRIEIGVIATDKKQNISLYIPLGYQDPNWNTKEKGISYYPNFKPLKEIEKYTVLELIQDTKTKEWLKTTPEQKEQLKQQVFNICSGELLLYRSVIEQRMFEFFNLDQKEYDSRANEFIDLFIDAD